MNNINWMNVNEYGNVCGIDVDTPNRTYAVVGPSEKKVGWIYINAVQIATTPTFRSTLKAKQSCAEFVFPETREEADDKDNTYFVELSTGERVTFKSRSEKAAKYRAYRIAHDLSKKGMRRNVLSWGLAMA